MARTFFNPSLLLGLPVELICNIFDFLETRDLVQCTLVSKDVRKITYESSRLQYTMELEKYRMVSLLPASASPPFSTRLKLLQNRERSWRMLDWKRRHILKLPPTGAVYEFVGGLYGNGREDDSRVTASISFLELPSEDIISVSSSEVPRELNMWTHSMNDVIIIDFTMDPSQDLLVLVALAPQESQYVYELHIRSIKTNEPHPKAPSSVFPSLLKPSVQIGPSDIIAAVRVQVAGNLVALLIKEVSDNSGAHLEIWNWEHGPQYSCHMARVSGIDDFTFLTHDTCLIVRPSGRFEVYNFVDPRYKSSNPALRTSFAFPPLTDGYMYWYISMSSNPAPGYIPCPTTHTSIETFLGSTRQIYYPRPEERVHACCLYIFNPTSDDLHTVFSFVFFLNISTLLNPPEEWFHLPSYEQPSHRQAPRPENASGNESDSSSTSSTPSSIGIPIHGLPTSPLPFPSSHIPINSPASTSGNFVPLTTDFLNSIPTFTPTNHAAGSIHTDTATFSPSSNRNVGTRVYGTTGCNPVPWEVWGPQSTRWFEDCLSTDWQHAIYGLRTVESVGISKMTNERQFPMHEWPWGSGNPTHANGTSASMTSTSSNGPQTVGGPGPVGHGSTELDSGVPKAERRFLRVRDFNPYSLSQAAEIDTQDHPSLKGKGKCRAHWCKPRLVTTPSVTAVNGVFKYDIISSLPYVEVVSDETFEVTDVMMDDCRLLVLRRGQAGKLKQIEVLML